MKKSILAESRSRGWVSAESAPPKIKARIAEIRRALLAGQPIPEPSAEYRSFAEASLKKLFPQRVNQRVETPKPDAHVETLRKELAALGIF